MKFAPVEPEGSNHWYGVPSLNHGVKPPCRCVTPRLYGRSPTVLLPPTMIVGSIGVSYLLGKRLFTLSNTGVPRLATITRQILAVDGRRVTIAPQASGADVEDYSGLFLLSTTKSASPMPMRTMNRSRRPCEAR